MKNLIIIITLIALGLKAQASKVQKRQLKTSICTDKDNVMIAMPGSCSGFFFCMNGTAIASSCGSFYHFNSRLNVCDHPRRAACELELKSEAATDQEAEEICLKANAQTHIFAKSKSCVQFYVCNNMQAIRRICPPQKHFNSKAKICQDIKLAECVYAKPLELPPAAKTPLNSIAIKPFTKHILKKKKVPESLCSRAKQDAMIPHPWDCGLFVYCVHGAPMVMTCPKGLHFSTRTQRCEWPVMAKCVVNN